MDTENVNGMEDEYDMSQCPTDEELDERLDAFVAHLPAELTPEQIEVLRRRTAHSQESKLTAMSLTDSFLI